MLSFRGALSITMICIAGYSCNSITQPPAGTDPGNRQQAVQAATNLLETIDNSDDTAPQSKTNAEKMDLKHNADSVKTSLKEKETQIQHNTEKK